MFIKVNFQRNDAFLCKLHAFNVVFLAFTAKIQNLTVCWRPFCFFSVIEITKVHLQDE